jgi:hypothetical protein
MKNLITQEMRGCFDYFWANSRKQDQTFGLTKDAYPNNHHLCSIAATGFALASFVVGIEYNFITYEEGKKAAQEVIATLKEIPHKSGFFYHFYDEDDYQKDIHKEISTIDSAILFMGLLVIARYFSGSLTKEADAIVNRANWTYFMNPETNVFYMSEIDNRRYSHWDRYAEQLMMYVLASGTSVKKHRVGKIYYDTMIKSWGNYGDFNFVYTWTGCLFAHQFSHAFIDFRTRYDQDGINWFDNSTQASLAARQYSIDHANEYRSYSKNSWGLSACDTVNGYIGNYGSPPSGLNNTMHRSDGTIPPYAAVSSIVFTPENSLAALQYYYSISNLVGKYGLKESFNLDQDWIFDKYLGIDKGITLLMLANYERELIWKLVMRHPIVINGLKNLKIKQGG